MKHSNSGFTLIEVMIALGVGMIVMAGIATIAHLNTLSFNHVEKNAQITSLMEEVKIALGDKNRCTYNLKGTPLVMSKPEGETVGEVKHFEVNGTPLNPVVVSGATTQGLIVQEIRLQPAAQVSAQKVVATLVLRFRRNHVLGPAEVTRTLPISAKVESGKLIECSAAASSEDLIAERICEIANGGQGEINEETGECIRTVKTQWFHGDAFLASCPAGWKLPPQANLWDNCDSEEPQGFIDTREEVQRTYQDGSVRSEGAPPVNHSIDVNQNACRCAYASGISSAGWTCSVECERW